MTLGPEFNPAILSGQFEDMLAHTGIDITHGKVNLGGRIYPSVHPTFTVSFRNNRFDGSHLSLHMPHESGVHSKLELSAKPWSPITYRFNTDLMRADPEDMDEKNYLNFDPIEGEEVRTNRVNYAGPEHMAKSVTRHFKNIDSKLRELHSDPTYRLDPHLLHHAAYQREQDLLSDPDTPVEAHWNATILNPANKENPFAGTQLVTGRLRRSRNWEFNRTRKVGPP